MAISAKDVNRLRKATGAGMMDCKKALTEADGDFDKAIEILRKKGQKVSAKRADREASEGAVFVKKSADGSKAVLVELNCETDFVARNDDFQTLGTKIVDLAEAESPADTDALKALAIDGRSVGDHLVDMIGKIGEKIDIGSYEVISGGDVVTYLHPGARIGVAVAFAGANGGDTEAVGRDVAMQIAAMNPVGIDKDDVSQEIVEREMRIGKEQAIQEGKPEHILDKIAAGFVKKFYKDNTLLNQEFVKDSKQTIKQYLNGVQNGLTVSSFARVSTEG